MAERIFRIIGRVISRRTGGGIAGLRVEAWDKDLIFDAFPITSTTED